MVIIVSGALSCLIKVLKLDIAALLISPAAKARRANAIDSAISKLAFATKETIITTRLAITRIAFSCSYL
jgi:hypothetical protein